jgi:hypothetical protein
LQADDKVWFGRLFKNLRVQGAIKIQDRRVYGDTREFEFFAATPQSGVFQQSEKPAGGGLDCMQL